MRVNYSSNANQNQRCKSKARQKVHIESFFVAQEMFTSIKDNRSRLFLLKLPGLGRRIFPPVAPNNRYSVLQLQEHESVVL